MFKELINDPFYLEYRFYDRCVLDYCILESSDYDGEITHKNAILYFIKKINKNGCDYSFYPEKMKGSLINIQDFFELPNNYEQEKYHISTNDFNRPYWFLFLNPPYQTNYTINDFIKINDLLFPRGKENLEIYDWNVDWSDYFDDGLEWWGARCISIYDKSLNRFVIILASATD